MEYQSLHVIGSRTSGGAERFYVRLCAALHAAGHDVLAVNPPASAVARELGNRAPQRHVKMRGVWDPLARWGLRRIVRNTGAPIVQTYMGRATRLMRVDGASSRHIARLGGFYDIKGYRHADAWVGNTRGICDHLIAAGLEAKRVFHIGNFVDPVDRAGLVSSGFRVDHDLPEDCWIVLFTGRLHPNKGVVDLLQALAATPPVLDGRPLRVLMLGDGPLRDELERATASLGLGEIVRWLGWVEDPGRYYANADLFVCPSVHEPLGNVVLEAWAHRVPVIATRSQGPLEIATDQHDAWLVDIGDTGGMAGAIETLLTVDNGLRCELAEAAHQTLAAAHSSEVITRAYLDLYDALAA
ncbi:MAG: glycosyltransferase [Pseudomonadota bacterium]